MWKSASVVGCQVIIFYIKIYFIFLNYQIAGAPPGYKGNEFSNMILGLSPTVKISSVRVFNEITSQIVACEQGFEAYDCFTGKIELVGLFDIMISILPIWC